MKGVEVVGFLPVVYLRSFKALVLADVHLGYEEELANAGVYVPRFQLNHVKKVLEEAFNAVDVSKLVIAGDLKHSFSGLGKVEKAELIKFFTYVLPKVDEVVVVRGNHDNYLPTLQRRYMFKFTEALPLGEYLIIHGHKDVVEEYSGWRYLIFGHEHPSISLRDSLGKLGKFPCYLVGELSDGREFVTLPAVGAYQTGSRITLNSETYISPILKKHALIRRIKPYIIDEDLGVFELPQLEYLSNFIVG